MRERKRERKREREREVRDERAGRERVIHRGTSAMFGRNKGGGSKRHKSFDACPGSK